MHDRCNADAQWLPQIRCFSYILIAALFFLLSSCKSSDPIVDYAIPEPPRKLGFQASSLAPGITMWTKLINKGTKNYVIEADLSQAELHSLSGAPTPTGKVGQMKFEEFWEKNKSQGNLLVLINGTFFQEYNKPTGIAFGLKQNQQFITYGYGLNEFPDRTMTVSWSSGQISIEPYNRSTFDGATSNVVGALAPSAGKNANKALPRTFIGVKNLRPDKAYSTVLLFISSSASQSEAEQTLRKFGAERVAMLDGGASTGLIITGEMMIKPKTRLPQTIGIFIK